MLQASCIFEEGVVQLTCTHAPVPFLPSRDKFYQAPLLLISLWVRGRFCEPIKARGGLGTRLLICSASYRHWLAHSWLVLYSRTHRKWAVTLDSGEAMKTFPGIV